MTLLSTLSTTVKGLAHDAVEALSSDESKGRQIVRDANDQSRAAEAAGVDVAVTLQIEKNTLRGLQAESASWLEKANKALDANDDALATEILTRKGAVDAKAAASKARIDALEPQVNAMKARIAQAVETNSHTAERVEMAYANARIADASIAAASVVTGMGDGAHVAETVARMERTSQEKMARSQVMGQHADAATGTDSDLNARVAALGASSPSDALAALKAQRAAAGKA